MSDSTTTHKWVQMPLLGDPNVQFCAKCNLVRNGTSDERPCKGTVRLRKMEEITHSHQTQPSANLPSASEIFQAGKSGPA